MLINYYNVKSIFPRDKANCPLHLGQLTTLDLIHDECGRSFTVKPCEVLSVDRMHWNGNLRIELIQDGIRYFGYITGTDPWKVEYYSPIGELVDVIDSTYYD